MASRKKKNGRSSRKNKRRSSAKRSWRWVVVREGLTVGLGVLLGLAAVGGFLWMRAVQDIRAWLDDPPQAVPARVWSAPVHVREGQQASVPDIAGDLLAAGYERVEALEGPGQFTAGVSSLSIWTERLEGPGFTVPEARDEVVVRDGRVASIGTADVVILRPTNLATLGDLEAVRTPVDLDELSPWVEPAVLVMEDRRFREHRGVDPLGIARALLHNLLGSRGLQGGSTLTQQVAKNLFLTQERTLQRKVREAFFATALETRLDKDQILETYLGEVYLGQVGGVPVYGVERAARGWFGVSARRLSLAQAATIAGVIASPNTWSPVRHPDRAVERRNVVLTALEGTGAVTAEQAEAAREAPLEITGTLAGPIRRAPWVVDTVVDRLEARVGAPVDGWEIHTHLQPLLQRAAEHAVSEGMAELETSYPKAAGAQVALVAVRVEDGAVVALVGGRDYQASPFNRATRALRQAGSTVKPMTLLAAFDDDPDLSPLSKVVDERIVREQQGEDERWIPHNYDGEHAGEITLREALEASRNIPAVKLAEEVGLDDLQSFYEACGLEHATSWHSAALGAFEVTPLQLASCYTVFPGGGTVARPWLLRAAVHPDAGTTETWEPSWAPLAAARAAALATHVLEGVIDNGTGARSRRYGVRGPVGGKTGTTDDYRDAWFVGFTPELAVAVWVGRDQGADLGLAGSRAALPTWSRFMVASGTQQGEFPRPDDVVTAEVCAESLQPARDACELTYTEWFTKGSIPRDRCDLHGGPTLEISKFLGGLFGGRNKADVVGEGAGPQD